MIKFPKWLFSGKYMYYNNANEHHHLAVDFSFLIRAASILVCVSFLKNYQFKVDDILIQFHYRVCGVFQQKIQSKLPLCMAHLSVTFKFFSSLWFGALRLQVFLQIVIKCIFKIYFWYVVA